eukprot:365084-Chlamydomonas_euryale.AAC.4
MLYLMRAAVGVLHDVPSEWMFQDIPPDVPPDGRRSGCGCRCGTGLTFCHHPWHGSFGPFAQIYADHPAPAPPVLSTPVWHHPFIHPHIQTYIHSSIHPPTHPSINPSIHLSTFS